MLSPDLVGGPEPLSRAAADYAVVRRAIAFVSERWRRQPEIDAIAAAVQAARTLPFHFTLTARAENFVRGKPDLEDTIKRLQA